MAAKTLNDYGCEFGRMIKKDMDFLVKKIDSINNRFDETDTNITKLFNHQSNRLPTWATIALSFLTMLVGALLGVIGRGIFNG